MHIILSFLGAVVTVLVLLSKLADAGISLGGLNPFLWDRRRKWKNQLTGNPIYSINEPMDVSALLMTAAAKIDGDMTAKEKRIILGAFEDEFGLTKKNAAGLLISSVYLMGNGDNITSKLEKIIEPSLMNFTNEQSKSTIALLESLCEKELEPSDLRREFVAKACKILKAPFLPKDKWA
ncbi:MAG: hypothetical protein AB8B79_10805 [Granulosicoccus sp.]